MTWRLLRANDILRQELAKILEQDLERSPEDVVTVTRVEASPDLQHAKAYISILPEKKAKDLLKVMRGSIFNIQQRLNARMRMRPVPKIEWVMEKNLLSVQKIDEIFDTIEKEEK
ncbi:MAG: 30S ribosome-binding factor RbfA [Candidatus Wildermuthbacteria bacterium]|nr:30S ribosome-binding factor RbfA [Candidatus Wildermuthbacteria bacterium]